MKLNIWQIVRTFNRPLHQKRRRPNLFRMSSFLLSVRFENPSKEYRPRTARRGCSAREIFFFALALCARAGFDSRRKDRGACSQGAGRGYSRQRRRPVRVTKTNLNRNTFGLGYFSFLSVFLPRYFSCKHLFLLSAFMPRKTIDKSMGCGRLFQAERQAKAPKGLLSWLFFALQPRPIEALVNCSVE